MISYETYCQIKQLAVKEKLQTAQIARQIGCDERTVKKWLACQNFTPRKSARRQSKLDPFKEFIIRELTRYPFSATQIFQKLKEEDYDGGYTIVKEFVRIVRPPKTQAFLKLAFAPAQCAQVDWGTFGTVKIGNTRRKLSFFVMVLCYSRLCFVEFTVSQTMEHFLACHQHAFEFFGGVVSKIMIDNLKSAVIKRILGEKPLLNSKYLDFANHYGFEVCPCAPRKGNEKGRVESGVGYVKKNFLAGLDIPDFSMLNPSVSLWMDTIANVRIHGETGEKPCERFNQEKNALIPLPVYPYDCATIRPARTSTQFRITLDTNTYSVPAHLAGKVLSLKIYPDRILIYDHVNLIASHPRSYDRRQDFELPDHPKELINQRKNARQQKLFARFLALSPCANDFYLQMQQRRINPMHHVQKIVALADIYGQSPVADALQDACNLQAFSCEYIANILEQRQNFSASPAPLLLTRNQDLLLIKLDPPDLSIYDTNSGL